MHGSMQPLKTPAAQGIEQALADALSGVLSVITGESVEVRCTAAPKLPAGPTVWFLSEFDELTKAALVLGGTRDLWLSVGRKLLAGANDEAALSAVREMVAKGVNKLALALSGEIKRDIAVTPPRELTAAPEPVSSGAVMGLEIEFRDGTKVTLNLFVDPKLAAMACAAQTDRACGPAGSSVNTKNLDLLLDVEMPVSVSFGRAQLPLKYLIKLTTGSIVELGRSVSEPVDIIVNNTVIARGEVVVVGGNFGVRIKEILSKQDRLRTLT